MSFHPLLTIPYIKPHGPSLSKVCSRCGQVKLVNHFTIKRDGPDGLNSACRQCEAERRAGKHSRRRTHSPEDRQRWRISEYERKGKVYRTLDQYNTELAEKRAKREQEQRIKATSRALRSLLALRKTYPREYYTWQSMLQRCYRPTHPKFKYYGARNITVCERWRFGDSVHTPFECFLADMGAKPEGLSIDRTNNDGNYEPGNCRWATYQEQRMNQR